MASRSRAPLAWLLAFAVSLPAGARAQSAQEKETARSLMEQGDAAASGGDQAAALRAYEAADEIMKVPTTGLARGRALVSVGRLVEAADVLARVARSPVVAGEDPVIAEARAEATRISGEIAPRIPSVTVEVSDLPAGVNPEIAVDGKPLPASLTGLPIKVDPGTHHLTVSAPGHAPVERDVSVAEGERARVAVRLVATEPAPAQPALAPVTRPEPAPPRDALRATGGGPTWPWIVGGLGLASLAGSGIALGVQLSAAGTLDDQCGPERASCPRSYDFGPDRSTEELGQGLFLGLGAVGLVGVGVAAIGLATASDGGSTAAWEFEPFVGPGGGGFALRGPLD